MERGDGGVGGCERREEGGKRTYKVVPLTLSEATEPTS